MPESLTFPIKNSPGVSNDRFGFMAFYTGFEPDAVGFSEVFLNLCVQDLVGSKIFVPLQSRFGNGAVAQLNRASDYGSEGCGFESLRRHKVFIVLVFVPV